VIAARAQARRGYHRRVHHEVLVFLLALTALLVLARLMGSACRRFGLPAVIGEIVSGVLLGKTVLARVSPRAFDGLFHEGPAQTMLTGYTTVAVVLLLVVAGLEIDLTVVRKSGRVVFYTGVLGLVIPFVFGYGLGAALPATDLADPGRRGVHAAFLGIALSISALPVIAKTLLDLGLLKTDIGLVILSAAVFNDIVGWIGFSVLAQQFAAGGTDPSAVLVSLLLTVVFVIAALVVVRPVADRLLAWMHGAEDAVNGRVLSMIMVLALAGASATQALGMHPVFGGFVMGIAIGDSPRLREHTRQILHAFVGYVFTPVFFATMALRYDFVAAFDARLVVLVVLIACAAKVLGSTLGARLGSLDWRGAFAVGFGMNSRGAMEILLAGLALEAKIINERMFVALMIMAIVTSLISGPALVRILRPSSGPIFELLRAGAILVDPLLVGGSPGAAPGSAPKPPGGLGAREALIRALSSALASRAGQPEHAEVYARCVLEREALSSTGVGEGVAIPHAEIPGLERPALAFARLAEGVDFDAPDGQPVRLVFLLLVPPRAHDRHLQLLSALARLLTQDEVKAGLHAARDPSGVLAVLDGATRTPLPRAA
jgi:Kef-type K+ transport system membrane component KefB/mannitol/fructose-specific phosphotransferase system IIA component (Ntr-type)